MIKKKVAVFQQVNDGTWLWQPVFWANPDQTDEEADERQPDGYVRLSPYIEIEFQEIDQGTVVEKQLEQLANAENEAREELQRKLSRINEARQNLLALSYKPAA